MKKKSQKKSQKRKRIRNSKKKRNNNTKKRRNNTKKRRNNTKKRRNNTKNMMGGAGIWDRFYSMFPGSGHEPGPEPGPEPNPEPGPEPEEEFYDVGESFASDIDEAFQEEAFQKEIEEMVINDRAAQAAYGNIDPYRDPDFADGDTKVEQHHIDTVEEASSKVIESIRSIIHNKEYVKLPSYEAGTGARRELDKILDIHEKILDGLEVIRSRSQIYDAIKRNDIDLVKNLLEKCTHKVTDEAGVGRIEHNWINKVVINNNGLREIFNEEMGAHRELKLMHLVVLRDSEKLLRNQGQSEKGIKIIRENNIKILDLLKENGARTDVVNSEGMTPLQLAMWWGDVSDGMIDWFTINGSGLPRRDHEEEEYDDDDEEEEEDDEDQ
jgi:hypothetical protein